jgi:hypothetical protein
MATDIVLKVLKEFHGEMREFREETRKTLGSHSHRLNVLEATIASLKADMGTLLTTAWD